MYSWLVLWFYGSGSMVVWFYGFPTVSVVLRLHHSIQRS